MGRTPGSSAVNRLMSLVLAILFAAAGPSWAQDTGSGESGSSKRLPSGRSRPPTPQRPADPRSESPTPPAVAPKAEPVLPPTPPAAPPVETFTPPPPAPVPSEVPPAPPSVPVEAPTKPVVPPPAPVEAPKPPPVLVPPKPVEIAPPPAAPQPVPVEKPIVPPAPVAPPAQVEAPTPAPATPPSAAESEKRLPSGRAKPTPTPRPAPVEPEAPAAPPVPAVVPPAPPAAPPPAQVEAPAPPSAAPKADVETPVTAPAVVGPKAPEGGPPALVPILPAEVAPEKRLPSGRARPAPTTPSRETVVAGEAPTQAQLEEFQRSNFIPIRDRWRIGYSGGLLDPYSQNLLKADYPVIGQDIFFNFVGISDSLFEARKLPTPQGISREQGGSAAFFGRGRQLFFNQNFVTSFELFKGSTAFRPRDWAVRVTPVFNVNYLDVRERNAVNLDIRNGTTRTDNQIAFQEVFVEKKLFDVSRNFDFVSVRAGIQGFTSDFRGFIFSDNEPGIRFFGNFDNNRYQWNVAYFNLLEKDTNSGLNSFETRHRQVIVANIYKQDFIWQGYTTQFSFHHDRDDSGTGDPNGQQYDRNGFLVRPARLGDSRPHNVRSYYLGWAGDGHIGRWNISHAFYQVLGDVTHEPIAGRSASINAQLAALELSYDIDWWRPKISLFYASGDRNPTDGTARGFDSILDNVNFAGSGFSFFNRQGIGLTSTGVFLNNRFSFLNDFRSSKTQGQAQFVNPGVIVANAGIDAELTPKLKAVLNFNYLWFAATEPLQYVLHQPSVRPTIGADYSAGFIYRPLLSQNIVLSGGLAMFTPAGGFKDIQVSENLYSAFFSATLTF